MLCVCGCVKKEHKQQRRFCWKWECEHMHVNFSDNAGCPVELVVNLLAKAGNLREVGSIPGSGRSSGGEHGNPLQYSCLENPMDRGA